MAGFMRDSAQASNRRMVERRLSRQNMLAQLLALGLKSPPRERKRAPLYNKLRRSLESASRSKSPSASWNSAHLKEGHHVFVRSGSPHLEA